MVLHFSWWPCKLVTSSKCFSGCRWSRHNMPSTDSVLTVAAVSEVGYIRQQVITMSSKLRFETGQMVQCKDLSNFEKGWSVMARRLDQSISKPAVVGIFLKWFKEGAVRKRRQGHGQPRLTDEHGTNTDPCGLTQQTSLCLLYCRGS